MLIKTMTAATNFTVRLKRINIHTLCCYLLIRLADQLVQSSKSPSTGFTESGIAEGQLARILPAECTNLIFNIVSDSSHISENLSLYASDGPCKDAEFSSATIEIHFLPCTRSYPIGLQFSGMNSTNCTCDYSTATAIPVDIRIRITMTAIYWISIKWPQTRAWISYNNDHLTGYLLYPNCLLTVYCLSINPPVNLNQPNGADT